jgi:hypothetical protein
MDSGDVGAETHYYRRANLGVQVFEENRSDFDRR